MRKLASIRVKANARNTCMECASTELIQAHHEIPGDDDSLIALCAEHHSQRHPDLPKALFFSTNNQPYWHNKSASSLAREFGIHPRTVIRAAKRLGIVPGLLSPRGEELIRGNIPKAYGHSGKLSPTGPLYIRISDEQKQRLVNKANELGLRLIAYCRMILMEAGRQKG